MNAAEALAYITARLHPDDDPAMSAYEVASLLPIAADVDTNGVRSDDADWVPTYSETGCYRAVTEGWLIKYGKAVGRYPFTTDGQTFQRNKLLDHIEHQRKFYARKVQCSPSTLGAAT